MFTGEIKSTGIIKDIRNFNNIKRLRIELNQPQNWQIKNGNSIAIDGVCLTVTDTDQHYICVDVMPETLSRTTLEQIKIDQQVNLEPALLATERLAGHFVLGHVDTTGSVLNTEGTKNGKNRIVPIMIELVNDLKKLKQNTNHIKWTMNDGKQYDFIFCDRNGKPYCLPTPSRWWNTYNQKLIKQGKMKTKMNFHKIRVTALSMFANELDLPIETVQKNAGHSDTTVTQRYYIKKDDSNKMMNLSK